MTISYTLDVSQTNTKSFIRLLVRWRGSVWKAVLWQLLMWTVAYLIISMIYRYAMTESQQKTFESLVHYLDDGLDKMIPLTFMLGFFVSFVVGRWGSILNGIGWIDDSAMLFALYIRGRDDKTRIVRRNLVRYMVLTQALVLRDISMQVRKRFPTLDTLAASSLMTEEEMHVLDGIHDPYSRYWAPIQWCYNLLYECKDDGRIEHVYLLNKMVDEISKFRHGLAALLKYDWVPVPLVYPQVIFIAVRIYFVICLIGRQFIIRKESEDYSPIDLYLPVTTMIQLCIYFGWNQVAEALLNPLGEDDDDLECNYVIDKNLITGLTIVEEGTAKIPEQKKDEFWGSDKIAPLYSMESAARTVHPLVGSASNINLVKGKSEIIMTPHKNKLSEMTEEEQSLHLRRVNVKAHNELHEAKRHRERANSPDTAMTRIRGRTKTSYVEYYEHVGPPVFNGFGKNSNTTHHTTTTTTANGDDPWQRTDLEMTPPPPRPLPPVSNMDPAHLPYKNYRTLDESSTEVEDLDGRTQL